MKAIAVVMRAIAAELQASRAVQAKTQAYAQPTSERVPTDKEVKIINDMSEDSRNFFQNYFEPMSHLVEDLHMHSSDTDASEDWYDRPPDSSYQARKTRRLRINPVPYRTIWATSAIRFIDQEIRSSKVVFNRTLAPRIPHEQYAPIEEGALPYVKRHVPSCRTPVEVDSIIKALGPYRFMLLIDKELEDRVRGEGIGKYRHWRMPGTVEPVQQWQGQPMTLAASSSSFVQSTEEQPVQSSVTKENQALEHGYTSANNVS